MKPLALCCIAALFLCRIALADDDIEFHVLAKAAVVGDTEWGQWVQDFSERYRNATKAAAARCGKDGKVARARLSQDSALQLGVFYRCVTPDDPDLLFAQTVQPMSAYEFQDAEKTCAALGKKIEKTGVNMLMFYTCVSPKDASPKPPEPPKAR